MPKVKESPSQQQDKIFKALVEQKKILLNIHMNDVIAKFLGIHERTLNYKLNDPDLFDCGEMRKIFRFLGFTEEEKGQVM